MKWLVFLSFALTAVCNSTMSLPSFPLAVKNPYVSTWLPGALGNNFAGGCPQFWTEAPLTWGVFALVNGHLYRLFGCPTGSGAGTMAVQKSRSFSATHTYVTMQAGSAEFELDFFSPVSLTDYTRQSIPLSYLSVKVLTPGSGSSKINILSVIDDTWTAQNDTTLSVTKTSGGSVILGLQGVNSVERSELNDMATYGEVVFAANTGFSSVTYQSGTSSNLLSQFAKHGALTSTKGYESGHLIGLGYQISNTIGASATFAIGLERDPAILWLNTPQSSYYKASYGTTSELVDHFFADKAAAEAESVTLDAQVQTIGNTISSKYSDLLQAGVRQIYGSVDFVIPSSSLDTTQAKVFMKEISTDGNVQTLADLLPKAWPFFYKMAPDVLRLLLEPIMEYTAQWPAKFAFHDLGKHYPNATGETVAAEEKLLLDQTSVIQWMAYAYQKASGNTQWVKPYLPALQKYADYAVQYGLYPKSESTSVDSIGPSPNQTVLATYAAIALNAFGEMSGMANYSARGKSYATKILKLGADSKNTHLKVHYNDSDDSWVTVYPFGFDKMLGLGTFNESTYSWLSDWYATKIQPFGIQITNAENYIVADLGFWTGAVSSSTVLNAYINGVYKAWTDPINSGAVGPTQWNVTGDNQGAWFLTTAKSIVGSFWMPVAI